MLDSPIDLIQATVQIEQTTGRGERIVGTGFLLSSPTADGSPGTLLVTANHVFAGMGTPQARIGFRTVKPDGSWLYTPAALDIRDASGAAMWTRHPTRDVAALRITAPPEFARAAIPIDYLAADEAFAEQNLRPGDELMVLGFPRGVSANGAGFPILRAGRIASYPLSPKSSPTFLLDFSVFPGNSGGPVFVTRSLQRAGGMKARPFIAGLLTQQVRIDDERLEIGIVTHAKYIAETIDLIEGVRRPRSVAAEIETAQTADAEMFAAEPAASTPKPVSAWRRLGLAIIHAPAAIANASANAIERFTHRVVAWLAPTAATA